MAVKTALQRFFLSAVVLVGMLPLFYFVSVEVQLAQAQSADSTGLGGPAELVDRELDNVAFGVGERLDFDINYGFINAGTASMEVIQLIEFQEKPCYRIETRANSNSFFSTFYKVEDRVESVMDAIGLYSWRFEKNLREGGYNSDRVYRFDQYQHTVEYEGDTMAVPPVVQDALSSLYFIRAQELVIGESIYVDNFTDGEQYLLEIKVLGKERISVDAGTFDCIIVEPLTQSVGVFKHEGRLKVWLTDDRVKMPVLMKSKVLVGSISAELTDYRLGEIEMF